MEIQNPRCPKCGSQHHWTVTDAYEVLDVPLIASMRDFGMLNTEDDRVKLAEKLEKYTVRFISCYSCGHVLNASVINKQEGVDLDTLDLI